MQNVICIEAEKWKLGIGFWIAREGKHIVMTNGERIITIHRENPVNAFTTGGIVKDAGLTIEEFKKLL